MGKKLKNISIVKKVFLLSVLLLALPTLIFSGYLYERQTEEFYKQLIEDRTVAVEQLTANIRTTITSASELSRDLAYRSPITSLLSRQDLRRYPVWSSRYIDDVVSSVKYSLKYQNLGIESALICFIDSDLEEDSYFRAASRMESLPFFQTFVEEEKTVGLYYLNGEAAVDYYKSCYGREVSRYSEVVIMIRQIIESSPQEPLGYIVFEMPPSGLFPKLFDSAAREDGYLAWFEDSQTHYGVQPPQELLEDLQGAPLRTGSIAIGGRQYLCETIGNFGVVIVDAQPVSRTSIVRSALNLSLILVWLAAAQMLILNLFIKRTFARLNRDLNVMDEIVAGGFEERIPIEREDEAGQIARRYNVLLDKINTLVEDLVKKETAHTAAQLKALQYQINPHFIYNTLSIFSGYAEQNGSAELAESIAAFGHLLRYNLKQDGLYATVDQELWNAQALVNVYAIRYFNRLQVEIHAEEAVREHRLIKFLIQPLLENSILHGLVPPRTEMLIKIHVERQGEALLLEIGDNGAGMTEERLREVREYALGSQPVQVPQTTGFFIGISNIWERLRLFYGERADMQIASSPEEGTRITIRLPWENENGGGRSG